MDMKKFLIILLTGFSLISCSDTGNSVSEKITSPVSADKPSPQLTGDLPQSAPPVKVETPAAPVVTPPEIIKTGQDIKGTVFVVGGTFIMGGNDSDASNDEKPVHSVTLSSYYIGKYEVTQKEFLEIMGTNPSGVAGDNLPVEKVSWFDAVKYCNAKSKNGGLPVAYNEETGELLDTSGKITTDVTKVAGYRLPTEAEWEFAARGGNQSAGYKYSGSNNAAEVAVFRVGTTAPAGSKKANELGIYDMSGNVWEWTTDWYKSYTKDNSVNPYISQKSSFRAGRGGSWGDDVPALVRVSDRNFETPTLRSPYLGFRIAKS